MSTTRYVRAKNAAACIWALETESPNAESLGNVFRQFALEEGFNVRRIRILSGARTTGGIGVLDCEEVYILFCGGTTREKGPNCINGWLDADESAKVNGFNTETWADAVNVVTRILAPVVERDVPIFLYGHSAGGMLVEAIAKLLATRGFFRVRELQTYGAPKPAFAGGCLTRPGLIRCRWMNQKDPVPHYPYQTPVGACWRFFTAFTGRSRPWLYQHGTGGMLLPGNGRILFTGLPQWTFGQQTFGEVRWIVGADDIWSNAHSAASYFRALVPVALNLPEPNEDAPIGPATNEPPPPFEPIMIAQMPPRERLIPQPVQIVDNHFAVASGQEYIVSLSGDPPMPFAKITKLVKADVLRIGNIYQVTWMNRPIMLCPTLSKCKVIARAINRFIRTMGNTDSVTAAATEQSLADFLAAAQIPGQGFEPPLNVV